MFKQQLSTFSLLSALVIPSAFATAPEQTGVIHFHGYVYDDTAIRDKEAFLENYLPYLLDNQDQQAAEALNQINHSELLSVKKTEHNNKTIIEVSFL